MEGSACLSEVVEASQAHLGVRHDSGRRVSGEASTGEDKARGRQESHSIHLQRGLRRPTGFLGYSCLTLSRHAEHPP